MNRNLVSMLILAMSLPVTAAAKGLLIYSPPQTGAPTSRIGGGTRGLTIESPQIEVLAPKQTALTGQAQPVLYWYLSQARQQTIEITLIKDGIDEPLLEKDLSAMSAGLQSIRLADYGVLLQAGEEYRWSVAIINDSDQRSKDIVASAALRYQPLPEGVITVEQKAQSGYWYDALQELIESHSPRVNDLIKQADLNIPSM